MQQTMTIDDAIKQASALFNQGQYQNAEIICSSILEKDPKHADANHILGIIAFKFNKHDVAVKLFKKAIRVNKKNPEYHANLGNAYNALGNSVNAIKSLRKALSLNNAVATMHFNLANIYYDLSNFSEAKKYYLSALKLNPTYALAFNNLGILYRDGGDLKKAERYFLRAIEVKADYVLAINNLAITYDSLGEFEKSRDNYQNALKLKPDYYEAFYNLGNLYKNKQDNRNAIVAYQKAIQINPKFVEAVNNIAVAYAELGEDESAIKNYLKAIQIDPDYKYTYLNYGNLFRQTGMYDLAISTYKKAIEIDPLFEDVYFSIGCVYADGEHSDKSIEFFKKVIYLNAQYAPAYKNMGNVYKDYGDFSAAETSFRKAIEINPVYSEAYRELSSVAVLNENELEEMKKILGLEEAMDIQKMHVAYGLGKAYENMKDYEKTFNYLEMANNHRRNIFPYDAENIRDMFSEIKALFTTEFIAKSMKYGNADTSPVFILGMPRSGSSLIEQILATHTHVFGGGEFNYMASLVNRMFSMPSKEDYPACVKNLSQDAIAPMAEEYLTLIRRHCDNEQYITDKMPHNFIYIGLIKILFPAAKIIHTRRDAMDNCFSIYKTGFFDGHAYADNLQDLGEYYLMYDDLMKHWNEVLPGAIYDVVYENMVSEQEKETRSLLVYCELPWEAECLVFYKTRRKVHTASSTQVRSSIYKDSVKQWKHYEKQLQPLKAALGY